MDPGFYGGPLRLHAGDGARRDGPAGGGWPFAYVVNSGDGTVSVIDTATNTVVGLPIPVGKEPFGVDVTPDGKHAYVANRGSNNVSVIDTATNMVVATVVVGNVPFNVAITPDGNHAYVANAGSSNVSVIDMAANTVGVPRSSWWGMPQLASPSPRTGNTPMSRISSPTMFR
jgi:YVTN family beta-propeller protein